MKYEEAQKRLEYYLNKGGPSTIAIEGAWGVGKTYICNNAIRQMSLAPNAISGISNVSAYYLSSLTDLRYATFSNFRSLKSDESTTISHYLIGRLFQNLSDMTRKYSRIIKTFGIARFVDADSASLHLSQSISRALVIIDDVERHQAALTMKAIFSHVAQLRDQQKCVVILILNSDQLGADEMLYRNEFDKFTDFHIKLLPDPSEAVKIAIPSNSENIALCRALETLEIVNIRVLKRIYQIYQEIIDAVPGLSERLQINIARLCAVYGYSQFGSDDIYRTYVETKMSAYTSSLSRKELSLEEDKISMKVAGTEIDLMRGEVTAVRVAIKSGTITSGVIETLVVEMEKYPTRDKSEFIKSWNDYHNDALADEFEIVSGWLAGFTDDVQRRSHSDLEGTYTTLQMLGRDLLADYILHRWIDAFRDKPEMVDPEGTWFQVAVTNPSIRSALLSVHSENVKVKSPFDIISKVRISDEEVETLLTHDVEWFERFIEIGAGGAENYHARIQALRQLQVNSHNGVQLRNRTEEAIKRFAGRNALNRVRLREAV